MGIRNISNSTNERTIIASILPRSAVGHKVTIIAGGLSYLEPLLCCFNSLVLDFIARQKIGGTDVCHFHLKQLPVISSDLITRKIGEVIIDNTNRLIATSNKLSEKLASENHLWDVKERDYCRAQLDALYARLYGLNREELMYILDPESVMGKDYPSQTFPGLKNKELREYGEYRTMRLVLEAWDRQERQPELWQ
jgi:hypothetical protein